MWSSRGFSEVVGYLGLVERSLQVGAVRVGPAPGAVPHAGAPVVSGHGLWGAVSAAAGAD